MFKICLNYINPSLIIQNRFRLVQAKLVLLEHRTESVHVYKHVQTVHPRGGSLSRLRKEHFLLW